MAVGEDIDFPAAAVIRSDKSVTAYRSCCIDGISAQFSACLSIYNIRMKALVCIFAGIASSAGLAVLRIFAEQKSAVILCKELFSQSLFTVKKHCMSCSAVAAH